VGGWLLAIEEMRGNLAELTRPPCCVHGAVAPPTVVFPIAALHPHLAAAAHGVAAVEGRARRPRTVHA
jgi:hypothetical protein